MCSGNAIGPYDDEGPTVAVLGEYIESQGYRTEMSGMRQHHEIYISDREGLHLRS